MRDHLHEVIYSKDVDRRLDHHAQRVGPDVDLLHQLESGQEVSRDGLETIRAQFRLFGNVFLEAERDVYEDYNVGLLYRIRF